MNFSTFLIFLALVSGLPRFFRKAENGVISPGMILTTLRNYLNQKRSKTDLRSFKQNQNILNRYFKNRDEMAQFA